MPSRCHVDFGSGSFVLDVGPSPRRKGPLVKTSPDIPITDLRVELNGNVIAPDDPACDDARGAVQAPRRRVGRCSCACL